MHYAGEDATVSTIVLTVCMACIMQTVQACSLRLPLVQIGLGVGLICTAPPKEEDLQCLQFCRLLGHLSTTTRHYLGSIWQHITLAV